MTSSEAWGVRELTVAYGGHVALAGVTLAAIPGQITALIGGDGAGKSSLLTALAGARRAEGGSVRRPPSERIGVLPASGGSWADLTVEENLRFVGGAYGVTGTALGHRIDDLLARTGLTPARERRADQLSGGMRQKLGFAMAVLHAPDLLILDEPTTGVDPVSRAELWRLVARAAADGAAVVLATTYLDEAERAAQIALLDGGRILATGAVADVVASIPGAVFEVSARPADLDRAWRAGSGWRVWSADAAPPVTGAHRVRPGLEDAVVIALLSEHAAVAT